MNDHTPTPTFEEICREGYEEYIEQYPFGDEPGFVRHMLQNYYLLIIRSGEQGGGAALKEFAEQMGLPKARPPVGQ